MGEEEPTGGEREPADPFVGWHFDEDFVQAAARHEASASDRVAAVQRARQQQRDREILRLQERAQQASARRRVRVGLGILALLCIAIFVLPATLSSDDGDHVAVRFGDPRWASGQVTARPSPDRSAGREPIGQPIDPPAEAGPHRFLADGRDGPVAYDPCRTIAVVVNDRTEPLAAEGLVAEALAEVARITGFELELEDPTDEVPEAAREPFQSDRWAPVLIAWTDPDEVPGLAGEVVGVGGSVPASNGRGELAYVSGMVALDGPDLAELLADAPTPRQGRALVRGVILHELGHLLGLDHVEAEGELMAPEADLATTDFGPGDLTGLVALGRGPCVPGL